jgi:hypothetical protein
MPITGIAAAARMPQAAKVSPRCRTSHHDEMD